MYSHLLLKAIIPSLLPSQIDELRLCNQHLNNHIERNRLDLPKTMMDYIEIERHYVCVRYTFENQSTFQQLMATDDLMKYLNSVTTKNLSINYDICNELLHPKWLAVIEEFTLSNMGQESVDMLTPSLKKCTKFMINNCPGVELDGILERMSYVEKLCCDHVVLSPEFIEKLALKTKLGPGIREFFYFNTQASPIDLHNIVDFIKNASFLGGEYTNDAVIRVRFVAGTESEFVEMLKAQNCSRFIKVEKCYYIAVTEELTVQFHFQQFLE